MVNGKDAEIKHLDNIVALIQGELKDIEKKKKSAKTRVLETRKYLWEQAPRLVRDGTDAIELSQGLLDLRRVEESLVFYTKEKERLRGLKDSPYFARIDVRFSEGTESIYIGVNGFIHPQTYQNLIYDWRAPIANLFYDHPVGMASYESPSGIITGEIVLKRQMRIEKGKMLYMFDSSINIEDEILQKILSQSTDGHMRDIVMTIQREQNKAIRDEAHDLVIVWGPGGSGKTSIALHRIAYLLYKNRAKMTAENVLIFSPSDIFQDYVADVLPSLGEENVKQETVQGAFLKIFTPLGYRVMHEFDEYENLFSDKARTYLRHEVLFKNSPQFLELLIRYAAYLKEQFKNTEDFVFGDEVLLSGAEFYNLLQEKYSYLPFRGRLEKVQRKLTLLLQSSLGKRQLEIYDQLHKENSGEHKNKYLMQKARRLALEEAVNIKVRIRGLRSPDLLSKYRDLFSDSDLCRRLIKDNLPIGFQGIAALTLESLDKKMLSKADLGALAFLTQQFDEMPFSDLIKHVVIDEVQDYSALELKVLRRAYPEAAFTVLGDPNQALLEKGDPGVYVLDSLGDLGYNVIELHKSYRSTKEITMFSTAFSEYTTKVEPVLRSGEKPTVILQAGLNKLIAILKALKDQSYRSIAIITKTYSKAGEVSAMLKGKGFLDFNLLGKESKTIPSGIIILPIFLAKGLEFDVAIVWECDSYAQTEKRLFYIACTRALHRLYLFGDEKGVLLEQADEGLLKDFDQSKM